MADVNQEALTKIISNLLNNGVKYASTYLRISLETDYLDVILPKNVIGPTRYLFR